MTERTRTQAANLLSECDLEVSDVNIEAVEKLLKWQPTARELRIDNDCPICKRRSTVYISYIIPTFDKSQDGKDQFCGYYCPRCEFTGAGIREVKQ